jgi:hypothetical protein
LAEKLPINRPRQLGERMPGIDDLIQPCPRQVVLAAIARFLWPHLRPQKRSKGGESQHAAPNQIAGKPQETGVFPAIKIHLTP